MFCSTLFGVILACLLCVVLASPFPALVHDSWGDAPCLQSALVDIEALIDSPDMMERTAEVVLAVPFHILADYLMNATLLPTWNTDYSTGASTAELPICDTFDARFTTQINVSIPDGYSFNAPLILTVNRTDSVALFGWQFGVSDDVSHDLLYYGAHWIGAFAETVNQRAVVRYISWEKIRSGKGHTFVRDHRSAFESGMSLTVLQPDLVGAMCLERVWAATATLNSRDVVVSCSAHVQAKPNLEDRFTKERPPPDG